MCVNCKVKEPEAPKAEKTLPVFEPIKGETERIYHYPDGGCVTIKNAIAICVRPSGSHRLTTNGGGKFIVAPGWRMIDIVADKWSL
jgi:hypothetical protein